MGGCIQLCGRGVASATDPEPLDQGAVTLDVALGQVVEHAATLADQKQQTTTTVVVVFVLLEVPGQI